MTAPDHAERAQWEFRQTRLAYRLLCAEARTQTICRFTSLSAHRLAKWRKRWGFHENERSRGPAPASFTGFFRIPALRAEGAYLAVLCDAFGLLRAASDRGSPFYTLAAGERLCDLYEFHRASCPTASVAFDQLVLLARGLQSGTSITLGRCDACGGVLLRDPLAIARAACDACRQLKRPQQREDAASHIPSSTSSGGSSTAQGALARSTR